MNAIPALFLGGPAHGKIIGVHPVDFRIRIPVSPGLHEWASTPLTWPMQPTEITYHRGEVHIFGRMIRVFVVEGQEHRRDDLAFDVILSDTGKAVAV